MHTTKSLNQRAPFLPSRLSRLISLFLFHVRKWRHTGECPGQPGYSWVWTIVSPTKAVKISSLYQAPASSKHRHVPEPCSENSSSLCRSSADLEYHTEHMESATKGRLPGKGIFYSLHSSTGVPERASGTKTDAGRNCRGLCHFLPPPLLPSPHPLFACKEDVAASSCTRLIWPTFPPSHSEASQINKAMGKKRHHVHKTRFPTKPGSGTGTELYFAARLLKPSSAPKFLKASVVMDASERKKPPFPQGSWTQPKCIGMSKLKTLNFFQRMFCTAGREVWRAPAYFHSDWQSHKRSVSEREDLCWGKEWQAYFHA